MVFCLFIYLNYGDFSVSFKKSTLIHIFCQIFAYGKLLPDTFSHFHFEPFLGTPPPFLYEPGFRAEYCLFIDGSWYISCFIKLPRLHPFFLEKTLLSMRCTRTNYECQPEASHSHHHLNPPHAHTQSISHL